MDVPVLTANPISLRRIIQFIYTHESELTEFGAMKIQITDACELALKQNTPLYKRTREQQVTRLHHSELIYSISRSKCDRFVQDRIDLPITSEASFGSALSHPDSNPYHTDVTLFPTKSFFYEKLNRKYFSMWHIPGQSLLQILSPKARSKFLPKATLAHGPGGVFPLATTEYGLSSLVYHHNGGARQWYIIPASEREALRILIQQNNYQIATQYEGLLIDPVMLDKYQVRYHRLIQYPNELVVLASGAVTQSFVTDTCWSEACMFALPSWIRGGHAFANQPSLMHHEHNDTNRDFIDLSVFTEKKIEEYITEQLSHPNLDETVLFSSSYMEALNAPSHTSDAIFSSSHHQENCEILAESIAMFDVIPDSEHTWNSDVPNILPINSSNETYVDESIFTSFDQNMFDSFETNVYDCANTHMITDVLQSLDELPQDSSANIFHGMLGQSFIDSEAMDSNRHHVKKRGEQKQVSRDNIHKTLFVSGLRKGVTKVDLYKQFPGSISVILKSSRSGEPFQYAFIVHRTVQQARRNLQIPIDQTYFGSSCSIVIAQEKKSSHLPPTSYRFWDEKTLVITKIPPQATPKDLQQVFPHGQILKFCSAHAVNHQKKPKPNPSERKMLTGYAFISFRTNEEVSNILGRADEYHLNGKPVKISLHRGNSSA